MSQVKRVVLDASALIAFLRREKGWEIVTNVLADERAECWVHAVNMAEVYRFFLGRINPGDHEPAGWRREAEAIVRDLRSIGVRIIEEIDQGIWKRAAVLKALLRYRHRTDGSYADCFCAALAERHGAPVLTTDHGEFEPLEAMGVCTVRFIR